jgi:hypothetical protein
MNGRRTRIGGAKQTKEHTKANKKTHKNDQRFLPLPMRDKREAHEAHSGDDEGDYVGSALRVYPQRRISLSHVQQAHASKREQHAHTNHGANLNIT